MYMYTQQIIASIALQEACLRDNRQHFAKLQYNKIDKN